MHNVEVWGSGVCPLMMRRRTTSKGAEVEEVLVGDIMALCIMSKCGEERCGDRFFSEREVGTGHYGIMHNVEAS